MRLLRVSLVVGALYDLGFALAMVFFPNLPAQWLALPLPVENFYLWLMAIFLVMLSSLYLAIAYDPWRFFPLVLIPIGGRLLGAIAFAVAALQRPELGGLWLLAAADILFSVIHGVCWSAAKR